MISHTADLTLVRSGNTTRVSQDCVQGNVDQVGVLLEPDSTRQADRKL